MEWEDHGGDEGEYEGDAVSEQEGRGAIRGVEGVEGDGGRVERNWTWPLEPVDEVGAVKVSFRWRIRC